ncbi:YchJ family metal-binding protein [Cyanobium sp. Morenito 9A2]|uniref:YchJ family protein n=1 Tax=Cyanobium sp. Morenito 9A2 TaxID=2823718 RepID=UPI0020CDFD37|nr:YchJ family metal-binding protein [Cyanobium sp. Morenito 9A2]
MTPPRPAVARGFAGSTSPLPEACPCGGGAYDSCCAPLIRGRQLASTAEELMRSRYSAFALALQESGAIDHLLRTHPEPGISERQRRRELQATCAQTRWLELMVLASRAGGSGDAEGTVEFQARWSQHGHSGVLAEHSRFGRGPEGQWLYLEALG